MPDAELLAASMPAWLLTANNEFKIAVGESSMAEFVRDSTLYSVPDAVDYCNQLILWRDRFIPVIDLNVILGESSIDARYIAVLGYQEYPGQEPQYVAVKLVTDVERVTVSDDTACDWPDDYPSEIQPIVESLFMEQDELVSVINLVDLCNEGYRDYLSELRKNQVGL